MKWEDIDWISLVHDRDKYRVVVKMVINLWVL